MSDKDIKIENLIDDLEQDVKVMMVDGELKTIREILNGIFKQDEEKRRYAEG